MKCSGFMNHEENIQKSKEMNNETLQRAKQLEQEIEELKKHYAFVKTDMENPYTEPASAMYLMPGNSGNQRKLRHIFLPIAMPEFAEMYLTKVEKHIKKLEKEFEKL